jgi:hypothetical protein
MVDVDAAIVFPRFVRRLKCRVMFVSMAYLSCQPFPLGPCLVVPAIVAASSPLSTISTAVGTNARNDQTTKLNDFSIRG